MKFAFLDIYLKRTTKGESKRIREWKKKVFWIIFKKSAIEIGDISLVFC